MVLGRGALVQGEGVAEGALGQYVAASEVTWLTQVPGTAENGLTFASAKPFALLRQDCCV